MAHQWRFNFALKAGAGADAKKHALVEEVFTSKANQDEPIDVVCLDIPKAFRPTVPPSADQENGSNENLKNTAFRVKLGSHLSSECIVQSGVPQGSVWLDPSASDIDIK